jgi:hypothetical protein
MDRISKNRILLFKFCLFIIVTLCMSAPALAAFPSYPSGVSCYSTITDQIPLSQPVTIDGAISSDSEWGSVPGCNITFGGYNDTYPDNIVNPVPGRLLFKHDATYLFILLIVETPYAYFYPNYVNIHFYDNTGTNAIDGLKWWAYGEFLYDQYNIGESWENDTPNVVGKAGSFTNNDLYYTVYEFKKELDSHDAYDFNLSSLPATIGFNIQFEINEDGSDLIYYYPDMIDIDYEQLVIGVSAPVVTPPTVATMPATDIKTTGATFNGTIIPNDHYSTSYYFEYGIDSSYGNSTVVNNISFSEPGTYAVTLPVNYGLNPVTDKTYHYRIVGSNSPGVFSYGNDQIFTIFVKDSDGDGIADAYDNRPYVYNSTQAVDDIYNVITLPDQSFEPGAPFWVQAKITNDTGQDIQTIKPDCYNTHWIFQGAKPLCRRGPAYGIPRDLITIPNGGSYLVKCDINEMFESFPPPGSPKISAVYENYIVDPDWEPTMPPGDCIVDNDCYVIWAGTVASAEQTINIGTSTYNRITADVSFNPDQWEAAWATGNSPPITARISNIDTSVITSDDVNSIRLNGSLEILPRSNQIVEGALYVQFDRAKAVQSLGSIQPGLDVSATIQGKIGNAYFSGSQNIGIVKNTGTLIVKAILHTVGIGRKPFCTKDPIVGMTVRLYDKSTGSCAAGHGICWKHYQDIYNDVYCAPVSQTFTDTKGIARFNPPSGNYLLIGDYETDDIYIGNSVGKISTGKEVIEHLQVIKMANCKKVPAKYSRFEGSELLVIEPEYVEWSDNTELYPFVFDSLGDWTVTTSVTPPEGFVADKDTLSAEVNNEVAAVQFTVTDIGSKWVGTKVKHKIKHKGQKEKVFVNEVGVKLSPKLATKKGLDIYGGDEPKKNKKNK